MRPTTVIPDTSALITLAKLDGLAWLPALFGRVLVAEAVAREFGTALPPDMVLSAPTRTSGLPPLPAVLGAGEADALHLAAETPGALLVLDDLEARRTAGRHHLPHVGCLRLLVLAKQRGLVPAVRPLALQMQANGFRMSPALFEWVCREAGE